MTSEGTWSSDHILNNKYRIIEQLPDTKYFELYRVQEVHPPYDTVIVKRLKPDKVKEEIWRERVVWELTVLRRVRHQFVLSIIDTHIEDDECYLVIEYADKGSLRQYLEDRPNHKLKPVEALEIALSICQGLEAVHTRGVIHCDVKPSNILLFAQPDGSVIAKLADFSIARVPSGWRNAPLLETQGATYAYASPEQIRGNVADERSDIFSWALIFFEMLTGEPPIASLKDISFLPRSDDFPTEFFLKRGVPPELAEVLRIALHTDPASRYPSAKALRGTLETIQPQLLIADINRHLSDGETHVRANEWREASHKFTQGLATCAWYGEAHELPANVRELAVRLTTGLCYTQAMTALAERQWQAAIESLEKVKASDPKYLGVDIANELRQVQSAQRLEHLIAEKRWAEVLRSATEFTTEYGSRPYGQTIGEIIKIALYSRGQELLDRGELEEAYDQFHNLHVTDSNYRDVKDLCADTAFRIGKRKDIPISRKHRVTWWERVLLHDPYHREGRTQKALDEERHHWAEELLRDDKQAGIAQLEKISPTYDHRDETNRLLVQTYYELGDQARKDHDWQEAIEWWKKAQATAPSPKNKVRWQIFEAQVQEWVASHSQDLMVVGIVVLILACGLSALNVWQIVNGLSTATLIPMTSTIPSTTTFILTTNRSPVSETPTATSPAHTFTPMPSLTLTSTVTSSPTHTRSPRPTPSATRLPTWTPTLTSTRLVVEPNPTSTTVPPTPPTLSVPSPTPPTPPGK